MAKTAGGCGGLSVLLERVGTVAPATPWRIWAWRGPRVRLGTVDCREAACCLTSAYAVAK